MSPGKTEVKHGKIVEFISLAKGCFRETYKSQNISSPWVSYRSKLKAYQLVFSGKFNKKLTYLYNFNIWLEPDPEVRCVYKVKVLVYVGLYFFPLNFDLQPK